MAASFFGKTGTLWVIWLALSGSYTFANMVVGAVVAAGVVWINPMPAVAAPLSWRTLVRALVYIPWLFGRMVASSIHMARLVLDPRLPINPQVVRYTPTCRNAWAIVFMANSVTLTPGTVTIHADEHELLVHAIDEESADDLMSGRLEQKIAPLFSSPPIVTANGPRP
ncbi:MAG: ABC transporter permease [Nitrospirae bacterium]|nr:MAG: ABC transporter permease [Nitrospirota bacterium]